MATRLSIAVAGAAMALVLAAPTGATAMTPAAAYREVAVRDAGVLTLGTALPDTGSLRAYGPATQAAVRIAVQDANAAGGVLGAPVILVPGDSGGTGSRTFSRTLSAMPEAQAIVGPLSSTIVLDNLAAVEGRTVISPAAASPKLTGIIARTVPAEPLAGAMLATIAHQRGALRLVVAGPREQQPLVDAALDRAGDLRLGATSVTYGTGQSAANVAARIVRASADAMLLASGAETTAILRELIRRGMPALVLLAPSAAAAVQSDDLRRGTLEGAQTVELDLRAPRGLTRRVQAIAPGTSEMSYAPQAYDAAAIAILAAEASAALTGQVTAAGVRAALPSVTSVGQACDTLAKCLRQLRQGIDIDYVGYAGPYDLDASGDPGAARYLVRTFGTTNRPGTTARPIAYP
jgi:branched-chain amino acid transport system substrate-binding protein